MRALAIAGVLVACDSGGAPPEVVVKKPPVVARGVAGIVPQTRHPRDGKQFGRLDEGLLLVDINARGIDAATIETGMKEAGTLAKLQRCIRRWRKPWRTYDLRFETDADGKVTKVEADKCMQDALVMQLAKPRNGGEVTLTINYAQEAESHTVSPLGALTLSVVAYGMPAAEIQKAFEATGTAFEACIKGAAKFDVTIGETEDELVVKPESLCIVDDANCRKGEPEEKACLPTATRALHLTHPGGANAKVGFLKGGEFPLDQLRL